MDENMWKMTQLILWVIGIQTTFIISILSFFWKDINDRFEKIDEKFDELNLDIRELRKNLNRMELAFYSQECCILKDDDKLKNVE